jgi:hypothetical protein
MARPSFNLSCSARSPSASIPPPTSWSPAWPFPLERKLKNSVRFRRFQRTASGLGMIGLGTYLALSESH